jgi:NADH-quinone oxidoreductase subunit G
MPKITVDGKQIECKDKAMILQAVLDAGGHVPHYCYHQGLSMPASCRICLVEVEGIPKLVPSCNTPIRDGMVVHSQSSKAIANQKQVMEYLLINHPLDCPVCDQAGECGLQDYSYEYGRSESRFEEDKAKKPKKDVGDNIYLYSDRCIMCTRCVRFTREISGTSELFVEGRGHKEEIDIFPGRPLNNKLAGNVVDLCPVGALLDKDFLFKQRVWLLKSTPSISPVDAGGENIYLNHNEGVIHRIKPRFNADVNQWWISDDTRYSYKVVGDEKRLRGARRLQYGSQVQAESFVKSIDEADTGMKSNGAAPGSLYGVFSPMMACEEAYLLGKYLRSIDPQAVLVMGPVPTAGENETFKNSTTGKQTFVIQAEKVPNKKGIERVFAMLGGPTEANFENFIKAAATNKALKAGWIVGGYLSDWVGKTAFPKGFKVVQDILPSSVADKADIVLPAAAWAEKDGCWENFAGKIQAFSGIVPIEGVKREGDVFYKLLGRKGLYVAADVRAEMGGDFASVAVPSDTKGSEEPAFEFAPL